MNEIWKSIYGYENIYEVSNNGRVRSLSRTAKGKNGASIPIKGRVLKLAKGQRYYHICLYKFGKSRTVLVHKLVANAFLGDRPKDLVIDHIDNDSLNNMVSNLQYISVRENITKDHRDSRDMPTGVHKRRGKYIARKGFGQEDFNLGAFDCVEKAKDVYERVGYDEARSIHFRLSRKSKYSGVLKTKSGRWWGKYCLDGVQYFTSPVDDKEQALKRLNELKLSNGHERTINTK